MEDKGIDLEHSKEVLEKMNKQIKEMEEKILKDKTPEEKEEIQKEWIEKEKIAEENAKKEMEKLELERKKWDSANLMSVDEIKTGLNEMIKDLDDKWNKDVESFIEALCKDKSPKEKDKIIKSINSSLNSNSSTKISEKMKSAQFVLSYDNSSLNQISTIIIADDYIYTQMNGKINEYVNKDKADKIKKISLENAIKIKEIEKNSNQVLNINDSTSDDIHIKTSERHYHLTSRINDKQIQTIYANLVNEIKKILELSDTEQ